ncbi:MAG: DNA-processing protein DprA [Candidatus Omnitrophota bacterium]|nr:DNA-processing protein DprA [Candidatus Omnitrophota bacterium]
MTELEALVGLNLISNIGSVRLGKLLEVFGKPQEIFSAKYEHLASIFGIGSQITADIVSFKKENIEKELSSAEKLGIKILTLNDNDYPENLKQIPGAPIVLYVLGSITAGDNLAIGIVGSRRASLYGLSNAEKFAVWLSARGITIVSGMARGVDTYAHRGVLKAKGRTIAVMGSGFNHIYPAENADLAKEISSSGAVISEFPMDTKPLPGNFPRRNRLISGLSLGVLITEAARNSGALITADFALEQGREVFALPGRIDSAGSMGTNNLLKQGAKIVTCCDDILEELNLAAGSIQKIEPVVKEQEIAYGKEESRLYACITQQPVAIDDLIQKSSLSSSQVLSLILKLQFKKLIKALPGKQFMRN